MHTKFFRFIKLATLSQKNVWVEYYLNLTRYVCNNVLLVQSSLKDFSVYALSYLARTVYISI